MVFWSVIGYIGMSTFLWLLNPWVGIIWTAITGVGFYIIVIWDTRDRKKRGEIPRR